MGGLLGGLGLGKEEKRDFGENETEGEGSFFFH